MMRRFIRWDAIFRAIGEGMQKAFWEDNVYTRLNFTALQLVKNDPQACGYHFHGKRLYPDAINAAESMASGAREAMQDNPLSHWRKERMERGNCT